MTNDLILLAIGLIIGWGIRLSFGRLVIREFGEWQFRLRRFDASENEIIQRVNSALSVGEKSGYTFAWRKYHETGHVPDPLDIWDDELHTPAAHQKETEE